MFIGYLFHLICECLPFAENALCIGATVKKNDMELGWKNGQTQQLAEELQRANKHEDAKPH